MLDYRFHTFMVLVQTESFTKTGELLHLTQPTITAQIRSLENELESTLYTYSKRRFALTEKGKAVYLYCCTVEQLNEQLKQNLNQLQQQPIRIVATSIIGNYMLPKVVAKWLNQDPTLRIEQAILSTPNCLAAIDQGEADCALIEGYIDASLYPCHTIKSAPIVCCVSPRHPLVQAKQIHLSDLLKYPLIVKERHETDRGIVPHALANHNLSYDSFINTVVAGSITGMKQMLINNSGIGFLHKDAILDEINHGMLKIIEIDDFKLNHDMVMIINPNSLFKSKMDQLFDELKQLKQ